jgi:hypothetical protein
MKEWGQFMPVFWSLGATCLFFAPVPHYRCFLKNFARMNTPSSVRYDLASIKSATSLLFEVSGKFGKICASSWNAPCKKITSPLALSRPGKNY